MQKLIKQISLVSSVFEVERITVITPDDSLECRLIIEQFKSQGVRGFWKPLKRLTKTDNRV